MRLDRYGCPPQNHDVTEVVVTLRLIEAGNFAGNIADDRDPSRISRGGFTDSLFDPNLQETLLIEKALR